MNNGDFTQFCKRLPEGIVSSVNGLNPKPASVGGQDWEGIFMCYVD